jgi:hypothetical protein
LTWVKPCSSPPDLEDPAEIHNGDALDMWTTDSSYATSSSPRPAWSFSRFRIWAQIETSSAATGSSSRIVCGSPDRCLAVVVTQTRADDTT